MFRTILKDMGILPKFYYHGLWQMMHSESTHALLCVELTFWNLMETYEYYLQYVAKTRSA